MTLREISRLAHRELAAYRTRSWAAVVTIGILFGLLLTMLFAVQGLESVVLKYAGYEMDGEVYLANLYDDTEVILARARKYHGEIVEPSEVRELGEEQVPEEMIIVKFHKLKDAYEYTEMTDAREMQYSIKEYRVAELFSNQVAVYRFFRDKTKSFVRPACIVLIGVSVFILAFTMAHLIASNTKTFMLYRAIGASKKQILGIYFVYLLELGFLAMVFALAVGLVLALVLSAVGWGYLSEQLAMRYPTAPGFWPILIGVNWRCLEVIISMYLAVPLAFLLCLDQFSSKKLMQKLKGD